MAKAKEKRRKRDKSEQEGSLKSNQSDGGYIPGSIASFLGSGQHDTSSSRDGALSLFFQPSITKPPVTTPTSLASKKQNSRAGKATSTSKEPSKEMKNERTTHALHSAPKRKGYDSDEYETGRAAKKKKRTSVIEDPEDPSVLSRTVFVGNLPIDITKQDLKGLFRIYGDIASVRFRSMGVADPKVSKKIAAIKQDLNPNRGSFNAYIVFKEDQGANAALQSNGRLFKKHHLRVDIASSKRHDVKRSIFVGNMPFKVEEEEIRDYFESCGTIEGVRLIRDKDTGVGKGFGYVLFADASSVQLALKMEGVKLNGRVLRIKRAVKKEKQKEQRHRPSSRSNFAQKRVAAKEKAKVKGSQGQRKKKPQGHKKQKGKKGR